MTAATAYLLDTNVVLHATRQGSPVAAAVEAQFKLSQSPFRPAICEVTVGELWAFAQSHTWGDARRDLLRQTIEKLLVLPISRPAIHRRWAELYSHARANGLAVQHDHNDVWIAATSHVAGFTLLSTDQSAFLPLRGTSWLSVRVLDPKSGVELQ
ncbi:MAG: PIN domain-containing protein [Opitutaceae bacterium]|nr:PIN domain-containing protein [Opitutaceae bacterium]